MSATPTHTEALVWEAAVKHLRDCAASEAAIILEMPVEDYLDGFKATFQQGPSQPPATLYALPWSRGWSIFATTMTNVGVYDWRNVHHAHRQFQRALYTPRDVMGAQHIPTNELVSAFVGIANMLMSVHERKVKWHASRNKTQ